MESSLIRVQDFNTSIGTKVIIKSQFHRTVCKLIKETYRDPEYMEYNRVALDHVVYMLERFEDQVPNVEMSDFNLRYNLNDFHFIINFSTSIVFRGKYCTGAVLKTENVLLVDSFEKVIHQSLKNIKFSYTLSGEEVTNSYLEDICLSHIKTESYFSEIIDILKQYEPEIHKRIKYNKSTI